MKSLTTICLINQDPVKLKGKPVSLDNGKEREEITPFPTKLKTKKQPTTKKENQVEKSRFVQILLVLGYLEGTTFGIFDIICSRPGDAINMPESH